MGGNSSTSTSTLRRFLDDYEIIQQCKEEGLSYLESKANGQEFLLRQMSSADEGNHQKTQQLLKQRQKQLQDNRHITALKKIVETQEDQFCMSFYKLYVLWEFPQRTLEDEINERIIQKRRFQEKQLWSILASCILGLSHLQKQDIKHNSLKSGAILISPDGYVKLFDPLATGSPNNYEKLLANRSKPHLYLSPQQTDSLKEERTFPCCDPFKTDIWTLGMILLEAGLLSYQDQCYRDGFSQIHWQTLQYNINRFQQAYSPELTNLLQFMLAKNEISRPDWAQLEEHVIKVQEDNGGIRQSKTGQVKEMHTFGKGGFSQAVIKAPPPVQQAQGSEKLLVLERKPLSYSKVQSFNEKNQAQIPNVSQIQKSKNTVIMYPSDISSSRPLRNIFPNNTYITHTKIDQNFTFEDPTLSLPSQVDCSLNPLNMTHHPEAEYVRQLYTQGSRYEGYKLNGVKHGIGKFFYQDGGMYDGQWVNGKMQGFGKLYYQSQRLAYEGQWKNDQFWGQGILYNQTPEQLNTYFNYRNFNELQQYWIKYEGEFRSDMKDGLGKLYLSNGEYYEGQFREDYLQGRGIFYGSRGLKVEGIWRRNMMD